MFKIFFYKRLSKNKFVKILVLQKSEPCKRLGDISECNLGLNRAQNDKQLRCGLENFLNRMRGIDGFFDHGISNLI